MMAETKDKYSKVLEGKILNQLTKQIDVTKDFIDLCEEIRLNKDITYEDAAQKFASGENRIQNHSDRLRELLRELRMHVGPSSDRVSMENHQER